ncbi:monovalent cation/H+ antiporter subunit B [Staphylococcus coagulans]|uniref:monovalent cation/H+ antiporter subunit B n=1 Tax=Staphylococcus coagulans TaxID=74706 RepID=UPI002927D7A4|nr:monovalent cation/H+ antiporter subunit B [Staphylococcus coagulans]MDU9267932.1 monovalent cation/H+ antiporter subunit B [Staphylococcus coagulans]MDU9280363.1 monovalent cation/H+ antiporter subunit B [Staphylococcus coagulans]MDU9292406.1 monovalent cation/H+ antiporter subunit B [Staphylococcus coagulans]MDU9305501.1 monovalent cation/H+ antiporter subunit B [Staphylococcus coagulans]MDU9321787.1 monovalent cation/H+ antiporter subunit B [Staphylococcus coagulans]
MKENDLVLKTVTRVVVFIILTFGFYLFFAGHNNPGGGFIAGLVLSSAFILMFLAFDVKKVLEALPIDFRKLMIVGALLSLATAIVPVFFGKNILYQEDWNVTFPYFGEVHLSTITLFEAGIALVVVGVVVTTILSLSGGKS